MVADKLSHRPEVLYFDEWHLTIPAEICAACSDWEEGVWVPASFCDRARKIMEEENEQ